MTAPAPAPAGSLTPFAAVLAGIAVFTLMDAAMKSASSVAGVFSALLLRNLIGTAMMAGPWLASRRGWPAWAVLRLHLMRSTLVAGMAALYFYGLVRVPMAEAIALSFIAPLIALYLAALLLGERVRRGALLASLLGFAGVVVIAAARLASGAPETRAADGIAAVLASAVLYAGNLVLQRRQAQLADPVEIASFQNALVALILLLLAPWLFVPPPLHALADIALAALTACVALLLLSWGYARAETQRLLPIEYTAFFWSALLGWWWFGEPLGIATVAGAVLIVGGCLLALRDVGRQGAAAAGEITAG